MNKLEEEIERQVKYEGEIQDLIVSIGTDNSQYSSETINSLSVVLETIKMHKDKLIRLHLKDKK